MKIVCDSDFKHGRDAFYKDDTRTVSDEDGAYFIGLGWAHAVGDDAKESAPTTTTTDLKVDNVQITPGVSNG